MAKPDVSGITDNYFTSVQKGFSDSLNGSITLSSTTIALNSLAGYSNDDWLFLWIEPGTANAELVYGEVFGNSLINCVRGILGTAAAHTSGATVASYVSSAHWELLKKALETEHSGDGTHGDVTADSVTTSGDIETTGGALVGDTISEHSAGSGITADSVLLKDGHVNGGGILTNVQIYTASDTWTKPSGLAFVEVEVLGGGGGGGAGGLSTHAIGVGAGGGAGAWAYSKIAAADLGSTETVTIGARGAGGSSSTGGNGGTSSFGTHTVAGGGKGGYWRSDVGFSANTGTSAGGTATAGDIQVNGHYGEASIALNTDDMKTGGGASSRYGAGGQWITTTAGGDANGNSATGYGAGGGGGLNDDPDTDSSGGNGTAGIVIVREYK